MIVAKYKFDKSVYENLIPIFNDGYNGYSISDEIDSTNSNHIIRTIECDILPTKIDFGVGGNVEQYTNRSDSLLAIYNLDTSAMTDGNRMIKGCRYITEINTSDWDTSNMVDMSGMFGYCNKLTSIDVSNFNTNNVKYINAMFYGCENLTSIDVSNFDTKNVTDMGYMFANCRNLTSLDVSGFDTKNVTDMRSMFDNCNNLTSLNVSNFDTSNATDMTAMFCDCTNLTSLDVSNFDTSEVTNMSWMFGGCQKLTSLDVSNFDTKNVTDMSGMFNSCYNLLSLDVSRWNTSKVTNMNNMFNFCYLLKNIDLSNWDTSNVKYVNGMFGRCRQMTMIDISNFNMSTIKTTNEDNYYHMFTEISNVKTLIFGNNKFPDDIDFIKLFGDTQPPSLEKIIVLEENTVNKLTDVLPDRSSESLGIIVTNATISDEVISTISSKNWSIRKLVAQYKFDANVYEDLIPGFNTEFSSSRYEIYDSVSEIVIDNILCERGALTDSLGTNATYNEETHSKTYRTKNYIPVIGNTTYHFSSWCHLYWYDENKKMIGEKIYFAGEASHLAPANAKYLRFYRGSGGHTNYSGPFILNDMTITAKLITRSIESKNGDLPTLMRFGREWTEGETDANNRTDSLLEILNMNTSELTSCNSMFRYNTNLTSINCEWDTSNVTSMCDMFANCKSLTSLDVSNWNTSKVTDMQYMFYKCKKLTSLDISNFDTSEVTIMEDMFYGCTKLTTLDVSNWDTGKVIYMSSLFHDCTKLTTVDVSRWNVDNVTRMDNLFNSCNELVSIDVSNWNTDNVQNMSCLFGWCYKLQSIDLSNWDTSEVVHMEYMFSECYELTSIGDMSNWDTSKVTSMYAMFDGCFNLTSLDLSNFDTSNVTTMHSMFYNCSNLTTLDVSNFITNNVTDMKGMFYGCTKLISLDVSNWNTSNVTDMGSMFNDCQSLTSLDVSNWDTSNVTSMNSMFFQCYKLTSLDLSTWDTSNVVNMYDMFVSTPLTRLNIGNWNTSKVKSVAHMLYNCESLIVLDINNFNISNLSIDNIILNTSSLRYIRCNNIYTINTLTSLLPSKTSLEQGILISDAKLSEETLTALASKNWTVISSDVLTKVAEYVYDSNTWNSLIPEFNSEFIDYFIDDIEDENGLVTRTISSMGGLPTSMGFGVKYPNPTGLKEKSLYNVNYIDTSNLISANEMFRYCANLMSINTANWDTSKITNMNNMFYNCSNLTSLDLSNFNTNKVANMNYMFINCSNLTSLDLSNFNTSKVTHMNYMFYGCSNLTSLDVSNFDTSNAAYMKYMFKGCTNLTTLDLSNFDISNIITMEEMFSSTPKLLDIGMLYCTPSTINTIASALPTTHTQTVWVKDTKPNECTVVSGVEFKEYKENSVMINLSSPLLQGDRIEVVDGKLCHYHKMGKVVLDGSEDEKWINYIFETITNSKDNVFSYKTKNTILDKMPKGGWNSIKCMCDTIESITKLANIYYRIQPNFLAIMLSSSMVNSGENGCIIISSNISDVLNFKQWLSQNPITVVYELAEPYYEDITPLQSDIVLETYLESNLDIYTDLPIKTNLTYLTNITNTSSIEEEINAINEGTDLTNLLEDEINN